MGTFNEPVLRCNHCNSLAFAAWDGCVKCGHHQAAPVVSFNANEFSIMEERGIDPEFFQLFEPATASRENDLFVRSRKHGEENRYQKEGNHRATEMA